MSTETTATEINTAMSDPAPEMESAPQTLVDLTIGLDIDGKWTTKAEVKELTGEDEEHLASFEKKKDLLYSEYMTEVLRLAVISLGDKQVNGDVGLLNSLSLADRDTLFLGIVKATYGDTRELRVNCPKCNVSNDVLLELEDDFPIKKPDFDPKKGLEVRTPKGKTYRLRLPNGQDMLDGQDKPDNVAEFNTVILANCALFDGPPPKDRITWAKKLNIGDRKKLIETLLSIELGPNLKEVDAHCADCGEHIPLTLDWVSLLFS